MKNMHNILAVDLGTHTGIAYNCGQEFFCETWHLATTKELKLAKLNRLNRRCDMRPQRLFDRLGKLHREVNFNIVIFEDVQFASSTYQTQLWASLRAALWLAFDAYFKYPIIECIGVGTLKLFAANHGAATKEMMSAALKRKHPEIWTPGLDDNQVDAAWLWHWGNANLTRAPKGDKIIT